MRQTQSGASGCVIIGQSISHDSIQLLTTTNDFVAIFYFTGQGRIQILR